jgi:hypothetical protein
MRNAGKQEKRTMGGKTLPVFLLSSFNSIPRFLRLNAFLAGSRWRFSSSFGK